MTTMISRFYASRRRAEAAAGELRNAGFRDVHRFGAAEGETAPDREGEIAALRAIGITRAMAETFADRLAAGNELVIVFAPFGKARLATTILDRHEPVGEAVAAPAPSAPMRQDATPLSTALGLSVLAKTKLPFESTFGIPSLTRAGWFATGGLGFGNANPAPFSSALSLPLLARGATPLSSMLGMRCLSSNPTPLSSTIGMPLLKGR